MSKINLINLAIKHADVPRSNAAKYFNFNLPAL